MGNLSFLSLNWVNCHLLDNSFINFFFLLLSLNFRLMMKCSIDSSFSCKLAPFYINILNIRTNYFYTDTTKAVSLPISMLTFITKYVLIPSSLLNNPLHHNFIFLSLVRIREGVCLQNYTDLAWLHFLSNFLPTLFGLFCKPQWEEFVHLNDICFTFLIVRVGLVPALKQKYLRRRKRH